MKRFDYTNYQKLLQSFDYEVDSFNPHTEIFQQYIEISENFDPINYPPEQAEKRTYIWNFIVPILQEYARNFLAVLEIEEEATSITINMITDAFLIIKDETDFKAILYYTTSFSIQSVDGKIKLELYFSIK